jgi:hypothetical protein
MDPRPCYDTTFFTDISISKNRPLTNYWPADPLARQFSSPTGLSCGVSSAPKGPPEPRSLPSSWESTGRCLLPPGGHPMDGKLTLSANHATSLATSTTFLTDADPLMLPNLHLCERSAAWRSHPASDHDPSSPQSTDGKKDGTSLPSNQVDPSTQTAPQYT